MGKSPRRIRHACHRAPRGARPSFFVETHSSSIDGADLQWGKRHLVSPTCWIDAFVPLVYRVKQIGPISLPRQAVLLPWDHVQMGERPYSELESEVVAVAKTSADRGTE